MTDYERVTQLRKDYEKASWISGFSGWIEIADAEEMIKTARYYRKIQLQDPDYGMRMNCANGSEGSLIEIKSKPEWTLAKMIKFAIAKEHYMNLDQVIKWMADYPEF